MRLELGSGHRGTRGYLHHDAYLFPGIDVAGNPWDLDYPDNSLEEVLALGFIEHLTYYQALDTFRNMHRMLEPGGKFLFDVPDYPVWAEQYLRHLRRELPVDGPTLEHCRRTLFGWQRWPGDEHKWGWDRASLTAAVEEVRFRVTYCMDKPALFIARTHRNRFHNLADAHLYAVCTK